MPRIYVRQIGRVLAVVCTLDYGRIRRSTGLQIDRRYWVKNVLSDKHPDYKHYMEVIGQNIEIISRAITEVGKNQPLTVDNVRKKIIDLEQAEFIRAGEQLGVQLKFTMTADFLDFIAEQKKTMKPNTIRNYTHTLELLRQFEIYSEERLDVATFDKTSFDKFVAWLSLVRDLLNNTVAKNVSVLKAFYGKMYPDVDRAYMKYKSYQPDVIALTEEELTIIKMTPMHGYKDKTKDLFLFLSYTGMRYSDSQRYHPAWLDDSLIEYSALKTKSRAYVPLFAAAKTVLEKWDGRPPVISMQKFNDYIKLVLKDCDLIRPVVLRDLQGRNEIETICPLWEAASSHLGRKTFISVLLEKGVPIQDLMKMSGHQDYRSMKPYIALNKKYLREYSMKLKF